jgi:hypothetical protein
VRARQDARQILDQAVLVVSDTTETELHLGNDEVDLALDHPSKIRDEILDPPALGPLGTEHDDWRVGQTLDELGRKQPVNVFSLQAHQSHAPVPSPMPTAAAVGGRGQTS